MRLIDADELKPDARVFITGYQFYSQYAIDKAPTVEAEPVRHGYWAIRPSGWSDYDCICSECGASGTPDYKYCHNCGAKMELTEESYE